MTTPDDPVTQSDLADISLPPGGRRWEDSLPALPSDWTYKNSVAYFLLGAALQEPSRDDFKYALVEVKRFFFEKYPGRHSPEYRKGLLQSMLSASAYLNAVYESRGMPGILDSAWGTMLLLLQQIDESPELFLSALCLAEKVGNVAIVNEAFSLTARIALQDAALASGYEFVGFDKDRVRERLQSDPSLRGTASLLSEKHIGISRNDLDGRVKEWQNWQHHLHEAGISKKRIPISHDFGVPANGKVPCVSCGREVLARTATRNAGQCVPCARAVRSPETSRVSEAVQHGSYETKDTLIGCGLLLFIVAALIFFLATA